MLEFEDEEVFEDEPEPGFLLRVWEEVWFFFAALRYRILKKTSRRGLLPVPRQPGLFYDVESKQIVNIRDF